MVKVGFVKRHSAKLVVGHLWSMGGTSVTERCTRHCEASCAAQRSHGGREEKRTHRATSLSRPACSGLVAESAPSRSSMRRRLPYCCRNEKISSAVMRATSCADTALRPHPAAMPLSQS